MNGSTQEKERSGGTTYRRWMKRAVAVSIASLAPAAMSDAPAQGTVVDIAPGHNITVFHNIDFIATFGHGLGDDLTVEVRRNGVVIGSSAGPTVETPEGPGLEVNHGPEGVPADGDCWVGHTPDIRPGDHVIVRGPAGTDRVIVDNIGFVGKPRELKNGDIVVPFNAYRANGRAIAPTFIDSAEFRAATNNSVRFEGNRVSPDRCGSATRRLSGRLATTTRTRSTSVSSAGPCSATATPPASATSPRCPPRACSTMVSRTPPVRRSAAPVPRPGGRSTTSRPR
jgi:hypothetical protein